MSVLNERARFVFKRNDGTGDGLVNFSFTACTDSLATMVANEIMLEPLAEVEAPTNEITLEPLAEVLIEDDLIDD